MNEIRKTKGFFRESSKLHISVYICFVFLLCSCVHTRLHEGGKESVIVIHGFGRRAFSMSALAKKIHAHGYEVRNVNYKSIYQSMDNIKKEVFKKFDQYISNNPDKKIHFVGHSLGGLLVRAYLTENKINSLGVVVLMGSPNKGTRLVNEHEDKWYFSWLGSAITELGTGETSGFLKTLHLPDYTVGVIAGSKPYNFSKNRLQGRHDGLVTVESTKLKGMHDFIEIDVNHSRMKRDPRVIRQVIYFLKHAQFKK